MSTRTDRQTVTLAVLALGVGAGCGSAAAGAAGGPGLVEIGPSASSSAAPEAEVELPAPTPTGPAPLRFTEGPPLRMRRGPPLKLVPIAKETEILALSPDGRSWVIEGSGNTARLVTPTRPSGVERPVWVPSALFSADGSRVVIWSSNGLDVLDVGSGKTLAAREGAVCGARFLSRDVVVFFEDSKETDARLWHLDLASGKASPLGAARAAETCHGSIDGKRWLVEAYATRAFVDGATGRARPLGKRAMSATLSRAGNRFCQGDDAGLSCVRLPDERIEQVWTRKTSDSIAFDITGEHAFITFADGPDDVSDAFALVDFEAATVRPLPDVKATSGSLFDLGPDGTLLTIGSALGLYVYDLERGELRFAAHAPLYGNYSFPYQPRRLVGGTDEPMDLFIVEVP